MKVWKEYCKYKVYDSEGFLEWFLKRKLEFWGKLGVSFLLFLLGVYIVTSPVRMVYLVHLTILLSIVVGGVELITILRDKK